MLKQPVRADLQRQPLGGIPAEIISPARAEVKTAASSLPLTKVTRRVPRKMIVEIGREEIEEREPRRDLTGERKPQRDRRETLGEAKTIAMTVMVVAIAVAEAAIGLIRVIVPRAITTIIVTTVKGTVIDAIVRTIHPLFTAVMRVIAMSEIAVSVTVDNLFFVFIYFFFFP